MLLKKEVVHYALQHFPASTRYTESRAPRPAATPPSSTWLSLVLSIWPANLFVWMLFASLLLTLLFYFLTKAMLPNDISKNAKLTNYIHQFWLLSWPNHVVGGDGWLNTVHQYVGIPFIRILDIFQKRFDVDSIHIITTTFSLWLQNIPLRSSNGCSKWLVPCLVLNMNILFAIMCHSGLLEWRHWSNPPWQQTWEECFRNLCMKLIWK